MDWKQVSADFRAKYEGCYCFVTVEGEVTPRLYYLSEVEHSSKAPMLYLHNDITGTIILKYDDSKSDIEFKMPEIGLFGYNNKTYMLRRKHDRQWKGTLSRHTMSVVDIYGALDSTRSIIVSPSWTDELVLAMFEPRPTLSIQQGITKLKTAVSVPLSSQFAIGRSLTENPDYILFYYESPIGLVSSKDGTVVLKETQFKQEFNDFISSIGGFRDYEIYR